MRRSTTFALSLLLVAAGLAAAGCANTRLVDYSTVKLELNYSGRRTVNVAVHDLRELVVSGEAQQNAVGETRSVGGTQAHLTTKSGATLAAIAADAIAAALKDKGFDAKVVEIAPSTARTDAEQKLLAAEPDYAYLLTINAWWSALHKTKSTLEWDLVLDVFDREGQRIAQSASAGKQQYGEDGMPIVEKVEESSDWGEPGAEAATPAAPEPEAAPEPPPAQPPVPKGDPDAFGDPDSFDDPNAKPEKKPEKEPEPEPEVSPEPPAEAEEPEPDKPDPYELVLGHAVESFAARLVELLNNPDIPRHMTRYEAVAPKANPLAPQDAPLVDDVSEGTYGAPPPPPPPE